MTSSIECQNIFRSLQLLDLFIKIGVKNLILCPGSRSAPLAIAAGELYKYGILNVFNSIDERSAGFHSLGISTASGDISLVVTTSGSAVGNLLPAAVEADRSCKSIVFITADRPLRLKNCGSNQTVNQEAFLNSVCRSTLSTNLNGIHKNNDDDILKIVKMIKKQLLQSPGPIHLNIPFEKPLDISLKNKRKTLKVFETLYLNKTCKFLKQNEQNKSIHFSKRIFESLDLSNSGIIIVGPYQGSIKDLVSFNNSLEKIQSITGWPVFADPVSGVSADLRGLVENWELIIKKNNNVIKCNQILRLGPLSSSNNLEKFLSDFDGIQILVKENNRRKLDPIKKSLEYEFGLTNFVNQLLGTYSDDQKKKKPLINLVKVLRREGQKISKILNEQIFLNKEITEYKLANFVPKIWPENYPIMLSASSPIRDWLTFSENGTLTRKCFSFRGASGIDGTLSLALGIARITQPLLLVTGDLALIHDINGFLIENSIDLNLTVLLINNNGGNIFNNLYKNNLEKEELKKLFLMPKSINWENLAKAFQVPIKIVSDLNKLPESFEWSLSMQKSVIIKVDINVDNEMKERSLILKKILNN
ncbi:Menaquinone biosynthesis protein [Prochlorococcus marinus str. MIT 9515]|uniref:2-succinyl-5-enolpyruvyl-6-hydroxy-3-cyclohexene-1-carboxylate synthase n=1 Tax=Prochlorococcus marinus (strain MIT 9515) TaxID=167542 RepID=MEND_PROM5|nr:2-succinyl-5-enolpyruvyl-6-hydroxy-3-cyclohexene-1-carboxylic-acid synthase [Prochlorococcus marinus]A2BVS0.1 RecName: Full=2-succinyl-5-enolpyruvyl-6-hydroxy-3-cyclohexene-1-carboxylate synthase; Short=SEPHCHC synthase [Prochlorococcus marinus str. MIT 9515]ABM71881.1 Menaquinone biosynthesis protein [Prochlorococcus marinus str. MIT 9515]